MRIGEREQSCLLWKSHESQSLGVIASKDIISIDMAVNYYNGNEECN